MQNFNTDIVKENNKTLVLIVNYRSSELIQRLVESVDEPSMDMDIVVLDNASTPETFRELQSITDKRVELLQSEANLGFTGGINFVIKYVTSQKRNYKYLFLLNPDALSRPDLVKNLAALLENNPQAAGVSPRIVYLNGGETWYSGAVINYRKGRVLNSVPSATAEKDDCFEVDVFSGCAVLFDMNKVLKVGLFSEDLFMYFDEAEFSIRLKKAGYKILYTPSYTIQHDVSYTTRNISHLKSYYMTRNKFIVFNTTMSPWNKLYFLLHELAFHVKNNRPRNAFYHLKGYYDFLRGKKGSLL